jgi:hypothetical protein
LEFDYIIGLDLGQASDFTALAVVERHRRPIRPQQASYALRHLQRFRLGTPYTQIVPAVARMTRIAPLAGRVAVVVDQTGVGRPVVDMLRGALIQAPVIPVTITAGRALKITADGSHRVPKKTLVLCLQRLLNAGRLKVARRLPEAKTFLQEMLNFRVRVTAAIHETFGAWRHGEHDDLVLAVALACWQGERTKSSLCA